MPSSDSEAVSIYLAPRGCEPTINHDEFDREFMANTSDVDGDIGVNMQLGTSLGTSYTDLGRLAESYRVILDLSQVIPTVLAVFAFLIFIVATAWKGVTLANASVRSAVLCQGHGMILVSGPGPSYRKFTTVNVQIPTFESDEGIIFRSREIVHPNSTPEDGVWTIFGFLKIPNTKLKICGFGLFWLREGGFLGAGRMEEEQYGTSTPKVPDVEY
ncbi:hypothetical protein BDZ94DRAFT_1234653 [Collybia nuda]|uniref:Uncharacterized protein n=1 Tax=Collybia nuda TaxID=64659 RepID=A0A9P5Y8H0_9AGAR|nr:hypothetical protein BDZ94DRAFT_1234653 [Collybia nuda]